MSKGYFYKTEDDVIVAVAFIHENAKDNTADQLAEKLGASKSVVANLIGLMRKEGIQVKTSGSAGRYKSAISKWASELKEKNEI